MVLPLLAVDAMQAARERELLELQACTFKPQTTPVPAYLLRQLQQQYEQQQAHEVQDGQEQYEGQYDAELNGQYAAHYVADAEGQFEGAGTSVYYDENGELYYADDVNGELQYNGEGQGYGYGGLDPVADLAAGNMMQHGSPEEMQYEQVGPDM